MVESTIHASGSGPRKISPPLVLCLGYLYILIICLLLCARGTLGEQTISYENVVFSFLSKNREVMNMESLIFYMLRLDH